MSNLRWRKYKINNNYIDFTSIDYKYSYAHLLAEGINEVYIIEKNSLFYTAYVISNVTNTIVRELGIYQNEEEVKLMCNHDLYKLIKPFL